MYLYEKYVDDGFVILEFPSNEFGKQEPESNGEIAVLCAVKFGICFPHFAKVLVNGEYANHLFKHLQNEPDIEWNFTKFLIDRSGNVVDRFEPTTDFAEIIVAIEKLM